MLEGYRAGTHPLINRFLRGVFNLRPSCPRYAETWDVQPVLEKLRTMDPLSELSLKELTLKLVMLMALTQAARVQTLHLLLGKGACIEESCITLWLGGNLKQCRPKFNIRMVKFLAYERDFRLCVVQTMKEYLVRTKNLRKNSDQDQGKLLISFIKPHGCVSKDTVARWIKSMLKGCGINTTIYTAGSVRPASVSKAKALNVPISTILAKAGWTQETTFARYYNKEIALSTDTFQRAVLDLA